LATIDRTTDPTTTEDARRRRRDREDDRARLVEDVRRTTGLMDAVVQRADHLGVEVPPTVMRCALAWRAWLRRLQHPAGGDDAC
jgi:hypothetical protein